MEPKTLSTEFEIPGKLFVTGEYLALRGGPSWVWTLPNVRFRGRVAERVPALHPESPAGLLAGRAHAKHLGLEWTEEPARGFGSSSAEFLAVLSALYPGVRDLNAQVSLYLENHRGVKPSAHDLAAQATGIGHFAVSGAAPSLQVESLPAKWLEPSLFVLSAAHQALRKVATHRHLDEARARMSEGLTEELYAIQKSTLAVLRARSLAGVAQGLHAYGVELARTGLVTEVTREDCAALREIPGVIAIKGSGAMGADVLVGLVSADVNWDTLRAAATERDLVWIWGGGASA